jgi:hypothetical protein
MKNLAEGGAGTAPGGAEAKMKKDAEGGAGTAPGGAV